MVWVPPNTCLIHWEVELILEDFSVTLWRLSDFYFTWDCVKICCHLLETCTDSESNAFIFQVRARGFKGEIQCKVLNAWFSDQMETVMTGAPQVSVLGAAMFNVLFSGRYGGIRCTLSRFADDTKMCVAVSMLEGRNAIRKNLDSIERWALHALGRSTSQVQGAAFVLGQFQAQLYRGPRMDWGQPWQKGFGGVDKYEAQRDPSRSQSRRHTHSPSGLSHPGLHQKQHD